MTTLNEGIYAQTTPTEEHATLATLFLPGRPYNNQPIINIGLKENVYEQSVYGQYYPTLQSGPHIGNDVALQFVPTDARFLFWQLGKQTATTGARTISNMDGTARKPYLSLWQQSNNLKRHAYGVPIQQTTLTMEVGKPPVVRQTGLAMKVATDTFSPTSTLTESTHFDILSAMTWDGDAYDPYALTMTLNQTVTPIPSYTGLYQEFHDQTPQMGVLNMVCSATNGEAAIADWTANAAKTFTFTLDKSANGHSIVGTFANARIQDVIVNDVIGREPIYNIVALIQTASFAVTDGI